MGTTNEEGVGRGEKTLEDYANEPCRCPSCLATERAEAVERLDAWLREPGREVHLEGVDEAGHQHVVLWQGRRAIAFRAGATLAEAIEAALDAASPPSTPDQQGL
jgi:hypothetical protein